MYSEQELEQQPLIDDDQWGRLENELGLEMLQEFAAEFLRKPAKSGSYPVSILFRWMRRHLNRWHTAARARRALSALKN